MKSFYLFLSLLLLACGQEINDLPITKGSELAVAARQQIGVTTSYDPAYASMKYPGGDIPKEKGVCTDVTIRALRLQGFDLQKLVHEDMKKNFYKIS